MAKPTIVADVKISALAVVHNVIDTELLEIYVFKFNGRRVTLIRFLRMRRGLAHKKYIVFKRWELLGGCDNNCPRPETPSEVYTRAVSIIKLRVRKSMDALYKNICKA